MAAKKRGKGGRFVKGSGKKGPKKKRAPKASTSGGSVPIGLLHKMDKTLTRIDNRLVPRRVKERLHRMKSKAEERAHARRQHERDEAALAAKYG